ncbi:MAG TPA: AraC family transcriptional regulator [Candidatus Elarobacter sp.]
MFVLAGRFEERAGSVQRDCGLGTMIFRPAGEPHEERFAQGHGRYISVALSDEWIALRELRAVRERPGIALHDDAFAELGRGLADELHRADAWSAASIESLVLESLVRIGRDAPASALPPRWIAAVCDALREDPAARHAVADLARIAGVHPAHFARTFRRHVGTTPAAYVRMLRLDEARRLIETTDAPLAAIAAATGFADQSHLTRRIRRSTGATPTGLRRSVRPRGAF